jgi:2-oxoglutarate dehydrogenase E2 component (dihydrolipoamide succinyltransferase)
VKVLMPQLGETVQEGTIATWYKKVGDKIEKNETLLDVETDKAAVEVPAQEAGVITAINVEAGETVDVGVVLAVIAVEGEEADEVVEEKAPEVVAPVATAEVAATPAPAVSANPLAAQPSAMLSPAVRRLVADNSLDVSAISGTGKGGRVTKQDVLEFIAQPSTVATAPISAAAPAAMAAAPSAAPIAGDSRSVIPFDRIRKMTADHMVMSKATSPHVLQAVEVDYGNVDAVRKKLSPQWKADKGYSLTYLPFIAKAICKAIAEFPKMNSSVEGDSLRVHGLINLGIAVDLNHQGLVVPVVHDCASLSVGQIAERIKELSTKARNKKLTPDDMSGGTYTISNSGPFGTHITAPVISQPQIAIMSTDGIKKRPVVLESDLGDSIVIRPVGILAQSFDHRAIDGAYNAAFMNRVREILEQTNWAAEI